VAVVGLVGGAPLSVVRAAASSVVGVRRMALSSLSQQRLAPTQGDGGHRQRWCVDDATGL
jgi:hypothetical protein